MKASKPKSYTRYRGGRQQEVREWTSQEMRLLGTAKAMNAL